jgi:hypothetical protein
MNAPASTLVGHFPIESVQGRGHGRICQTLAC